MTKLERTIRQVSDLRDFYLKIQKEKNKSPKAGTPKRRSRPARPPAQRA
jgi:hypothetical protein